MTNPTSLTTPLPPVPSMLEVVDTASNKFVSQPWMNWLVLARNKINVIGDVLVTIGGSGTTQAAFDSISPLTTTGDILTYSGGHNVRLPIGTNGQILSVVSGVPAWVNPSAGSSPLTTKGDIYGYNTANARIPVGTDGQVLTADSTNALGVSWKSPTSVSLNGAYLNASAQTPTTTTGVVWNNPAIFDPDGYWNSASPTRLTVPVGKGGRLFHVFTTIEVNSSAGGRVNIYVNGIRRLIGPFITTYVLANSGIIYLADSDYVEVIMAQTTAIITTDQTPIFSLCPI